MLFFINALSAIESLCSYALKCTQYLGYRAILVIGTQTALQFAYRIPEKLAL